jgi:hypothetical protein
MKNNKCTGMNTELTELTAEETTFVTGGSGYLIASGRTSDSTTQTADAQRGSSLIGTNL